MKKPPAGWPQIASALFYDDAAKAIDWLVRPFGFEVRLKDRGRRRPHRALRARVRRGARSWWAARADVPRPSLPWRRARARVGGANTQNLCVYVDDVDAHCARARAAGAKIVDEPTTSRLRRGLLDGPQLRAPSDLEGHHWWFMQRLREPKVRAEEARPDARRARPTRRASRSFASCGRSRAARATSPKALSMSRPAMSRHLRILRRSGLVEEEAVEDDARVRVYQLRPRAVRRARPLARRGRGVLGRPAPRLQGARGAQVRKRGP